LKGRDCYNCRFTRGQTTHLARREACLAPAGIRRNRVDFYLGLAFQEVEDGVQLAFSDDGSPTLDSAGENQGLLSLMFPAVLGYAAGRGLAPSRCSDGLKIVMSNSAILLSLSLVIAAASCARGREPTPSAAPVAATPAASGAEDNSNPPIGSVDATIMFTDCGVVSNMNAQVAQKTMRQLVEACNEVPGGTAQFTATLLVDGRIELATNDGGTGTVPICVLRHELKHKVVVKKPCIMQVKMSERKATPSGK